MRGYVDQGWMENIPLYGLESFFQSKGDGAADLGDKAPL